MKLLTEDERSNLDYELTKFGTITAVAVFELERWVEKVKEVVDG